MHLTSRPRLRRRAQRGQARGGDDDSRTGSQETERRSGPTMYSVPHRTFAAADGGACTSLAGTCERRVRSWTRASSRKSQKGLQIHDGHARGSMLGADYPGVSSADNLTSRLGYSHAPPIGQSALVRARPPLRSPTYPFSPSFEAIRPEAPDAGAACGCRPLAQRPSEARYASLPIG